MKNRCSEDPQGKYYSYCILVLKCVKIKNNILGIDFKIIYKSIFYFDFVAIETFTTYLISFQVT